MRVKLWFRGPPPCESLLTAGAALPNAIRAPAEHPEALAGVLVAAVRRTGRPLAILAADLGLDYQDGSILRLALAPCPRADTLTQDLAVLVAATGVDGAALGELIRAAQLAAPEEPADPDPDRESVPF